MLSFSTVRSWRNSDIESVMEDKNLEPENGKMSCRSPLSSMDEPLLYFPPPMENVVSFGSSWSASTALRTPSSSLDPTEDLLPQATSPYLQSDNDGAEHSVRFSDFLGTPLEPDPDFHALRLLKNSFMTFAPLARMQTRPVNSNSFATSESKEGAAASEPEEEWIECSESNDNGGLIIRGWSPPADDKFPLANIDLDGWIPWPTVTSSSVRLLSGTNGNHNPHGIRNTDDEGMKRIVEIGSPLNDGMASSVVQGICQPKASPPKSWARRNPIIWHSNSIDQAAKRRRGANGEFVSISHSKDPKMCSPDAASSYLSRTVSHSSAISLGGCSPSGPLLGSTTGFPVNQSSHKLACASDNEAPEHGGAALNNAGNEKKQIQAAGPRLHAFLTPDLARSVTQSSLRMRAEESERVRKRQEEELRKLDERSQREERDTACASYMPPPLPGRNENAIQPKSMVPRLSEIGASKSTRINSLPILSAQRNSMTQQGCLSDVVAVHGSTGQIALRPLRPHNYSHPPPQKPEIQSVSSVPIAVSAAIPCLKATVGVDQQAMLRAVAANLAMSLKRTLSESYTGNRASDLSQTAFVEVAPVVASVTVTAPPPPFNPRGALQTGNVHDTDRLGRYKSE